MIEIMDFFYLMLIFSSGTLISSVFVSQMWFRYMLLSEKKMKECEEELEYYEDKYDIRKIKENNIPNIEDIITEITPEDGEVNMRYNKDCEGFEYWCDDKNINFKILKTVCRKYCTIFKTKDLYIDSYDEFTKQRNNYKKILEDYKKEESEEEEDSVFIRRKKDKKPVFKPDWKENKFIRRGKLNESPLYKKDEEPKKKTKLLSFDQFKNFMKLKSN